jgi:hypothetical protein
MEMLRDVCFAQNFGESVKEKKKEEETNVYALLTTINPNSVRKLDEKYY